ncbi:hypothetical protein [Alicyclobacillus sp.]|uniref:hypothetical protein n=1 Tax=Alicyclobacillus sp. TaxID=61169 RepID=UPI0025C0112C|nr:hypothetical protein [Alicyclobacillus sp.]MCL6517115.1 hypothetical protein [Alicyclobacillus sp.]
MYVSRSQQRGIRVRVLDCFDEYHHRLNRWFGEDVLQVEGHRAAVRRAVAAEGFDAALVHDAGDLVRTALIIQALHDAGIPNVMVVTQDARRRPVYRRCGAHQVLVAVHPEQAWQAVSRELPSFVSA